MNISQAALTCENFWEQESGHIHVPSMGWWPDRRAGVSTDTCWLTASRNRAENRENHLFLSIPGHVYLPSQ